jgi:hypothetical protein
MRGTNQQELRLAGAIAEWKMSKPWGWEFVSENVVRGVADGLKTVFWRAELVGLRAGKLAGRQQENRHFSC